MVGAILAFKPSFADVQQWVRVNWKRYNPKVFHVKLGVYLFEFQNEENKLEVLGRAWTFYHKSPVTLKEWNSDMDLDNINFNKIPVLVQFPNLKKRFWPAKVLSKLASYVGRPVAADPLTIARTRLSYARLLVEVDVQGSLPKLIPITGPAGETMVQPVRYEFRMPKCSKCHMTGHEAEECRKKQGTAKPPPKKESKSEPVIEKVDVPGSSNAAKEDVPSDVVKNTTKGNGSNLGKTLVNDEAAPLPKENPGQRTGNARQHKKDQSKGQPPKNSSKTKSPIIQNRSAAAGGKTAATTGYTLQRGNTQPSLPND